MFYVVMCEPNNEQSVTTRKVRVIHWAPGAHDFAIFLGFVS